MKNITLYTITIPLFIRYLSNLVRILEKAKRFSVKNGVSEQQLVSGRLAPDMYTLVQQVGHAYFMALETTANLSGIEGPKLTYDEKSLGELQKSLRKVIAFLESCPERKFNTGDTKQVATFLHQGKKYSKREYVINLALPNFFFHVTTTYDILRHNGIPLGKDDFLGISPSPKKKR